MVNRSCLCVVPLSSDLSFYNSTALYLLSAFVVCWSPGKPLPLQPHSRVKMILSSSSKRLCVLGLAKACASPASTNVTVFKRSGSWRCDFASSKGVWVCSWIITTIHPCTRHYHHRLFPSPVQVPLVFSSQYLDPNPSNEQPVTWFLSLQSFSISAILIGMQWYLTVILNCISLMT